jgi:hypothetical protein
MGAGEGGGCVVVWDINMFCEAIGTIHNPAASCKCELPGTTGGIWLTCACLLKQPISPGVATFDIRHGRCE